MHSNETKPEQVLCPKRRSKPEGPVAPIELTSYPQGESILKKRLPRMNKSGRPHRNWAAPALEHSGETIEMVPVKPALNELVELFTRVCLHPLQSYYSR